MKLLNLHWPTLCFYSADNFLLAGNNLGLVHVAPFTNTQDRFQARNTDSSHIVCLPSKQDGWGQQQHPRPLWYRLTYCTFIKGITSVSLSLRNCHQHVMALRRSRTAAGAAESTWQMYLFVIYVLMKDLLIYFRKGAVFHSFPEISGKVTLFPPTV